MINRKEITNILGTSLNNEVQLIVCTKDINNKEINTNLVNTAKNKTLKNMTKLFGGCTVTQSSGTWLNNGQLEEEPNFILSSNFNDTLLTLKTIEQIKKYATSLKKELSQDAVSIKLNGELFFI